MTIRSWSTTPANNNSSPPNGWPEGMAPSGVNNSARQMMAEIRETFEALGYFDYGDTPTRVDADTFTVATDLTARYTAGKQIKLVGATTEYGAISSSSYSAPNTTVEVVGTVPTSLSTVSIGITAQPEYRMTSKEIAASVTVVDASIPSHDIVGDVIVNRYGKNSTPGTTDMNTAEAAAQLVAAQLGNGGKVKYLAQNYYSSNTITCNADRVTIEGQGKHCTTWSFNPASAKARFKFQASNSANVIYQGGVRGGCFTGSGSEQKIAIDLYDASEFLIEECATRTWTGNSGSSTTPSIAVRTKGREYLTIRKCDFYADRPIHIIRNANSPSLSSDHTHFEDVNTSPQVTTEANILIDSDAGISNWSIDGYLALVGGKYGIRYLDGTEPSAALNIHLANARFEGATDLTGFAVDWNCTANGLTFENFGFGGSGSPTSGGLRIRNVSQCGALLIGTTYSGQGTALDMDSTVCKLETVGCSWQTGSTATLSGVSIIKQNSLVTSGPVPETGIIMPTGLYGDINEVAQAGALVSVTNNSSTKIASSTYTGALVISSSGTQGAMYWCRGTTHTTYKAWESDAFSSSTKDNGGTVNIYWDTDGYYIQNKTGSTLTFGISRLGTIR